MRQNPLKKIVELQKQGKNVGIYSVCSANGYVIEAAFKRGLSDGSCVLIESTANHKSDIIKHLSPVRPNRSFPRHFDISRHSACHSRAVLS